MPGLATSLPQRPLTVLWVGTAVGEWALSRGLRAAPEWCCAPQALPSLPSLGVGAAVAVVVAVLAIVIAVVVIRRISVRRALASRVEYLLLPSTTFDPTPEEVQRFALQLTRTRPAESRLRPRRGASVRIRMATDADGRLVYSLSGPGHARSVLRHPTYHQVELRAEEKGEESP